MNHDIEISGDHARHQFEVEPIDVTEKFIEALADENIYQFDAGYFARKGLITEPVYAIDTNTPGRPLHGSGSRMYIPITIFNAANAYAGHESASWGINKTLKPMITQFDAAWLQGRVLELSYKQGSPRHANPETASPEIKVLMPRASATCEVFSEMWNARDFAGADIDAAFVQDNHVRDPLRGALRGLHCQAPPAAQGKRVSRGAIFDVAVDIRRG